MPQVQSIADAIYTAPRFDLPGILKCDRPNMGAGDLYGVDVRGTAIDLGGTLDVRRCRSLRSLQQANDQPLPTLGGNGFPLI